MRWIALKCFFMFSHSKNKIIMNLKNLFFLTIAACPSVAFSQIELSDSIPINSHDSISIPAKLNIDSISPARHFAMENWSYIPSADPLFPYRTAYPIDLHIPDLSYTPGQARIFNWKGGEILATGGIITFPGLMQIETGSIGVNQNIGKFSFYAGAIVNKYGFFQGLHTQYGVNGSISYQIMPQLSFTAFGTYYFGKPFDMPNGSRMAPAMAGFYGRSLFGGTLDYQINENWGVEAGAQAVQSIGMKRFEPEPIVTPYYKIGKKVKIGLPVGQILYHIIRNR